MQDKKQYTFNADEYLSKFPTKELLKEELAKVQRNMENIRFGRFDWHDRLWRRKRVLLDKYYREYCTREYYMDDLGRTHWYYIEIEEWQKLHNIAPNGTKAVLDE